MEGALPPFSVKAYLKSVQTPFSPGFPSSPVTFTGSLHSPETRLVVPFTKPTDIHQLLSPSVGASIHVYLLSADLIGGYGLVPLGLEGLVSDFTKTYCFQLPFSPLIHTGSVQPSLKASVYTVLSGLIVAIVIHKY